MKKWKTIVIFVISTLKFVYLQKFATKQKCLDLGPKVPYLGIFGVEFWKTIVIFEISTLKFVYLPNFARQQNYLNFGPKVPYLGIFGPEFWKTIVIFEISTLKLVKSGSLTHTVNFDIGSAFSKGPESAFSEGPGPSSGPLYKVCPAKHTPEKN